jgi:hypothetical protein
MINLKYIAAFCIVFLHGLSLFADDNRENKLLPPAQARLSGEVFTFNLHADGSMYYFDAWAQGKVTLITGEVVEAENLRYNGYLDQLIWLNPANFQQIQVDKQMVKSFSMELPYLQEELYFENITFKPWFEANPMNIFAQILYQGEIRLLAHRRVSRKGEEIENVGSALVARAKLEPAPVFYILMPDGQAHAIRQINRRAIYRIFPEHANQIRDALRRNNIRLRNEQDLIEAVKITEKLIF